MNDTPLRFATAEDVWRLLQARVRPGRTETLRAIDALGRVLAADVQHALDYPPFDRAIMDGYAVRCADFETRAAGSGNGVRLRVVGLQRAGGGAAPVVASGTCVQINTGAAVPAGADAIVMVEKSSPVGADVVELLDHPKPGQHIERRAGLGRRGERLVAAPARITPGVLSAIAAAGLREVCVYAAPRVALLTTGDELLLSSDDARVANGPSNAERQGADQIPESNSIVLRRLIEACGGRTACVWHAPDQLDALRAALADGLKCDVLCITGGMSKGSHDLVPPALESLGVQWLVTSLNLKPGKPTRIGRGPAGTWVVGLPGNPVSCVVCFWLFARPILSGLQGLPAGRPIHCTAILAQPLPATGERPMFMPARWFADADGAARASPQPWRGSGDPFGLAQANALVYRPARAPAAVAGASVSVFPLFEMQ